MRHCARKATEDPETDDENRLRLDDWELKPERQEQAKGLPQRLDLDLPVEADDANLREGHAGAEPHRHALVERGVGHGGPAGPGLGRDVPQ